MSRREIPRDLIGQLKLLRRKISRSEKEKAVLLFAARHLVAER